MFLLKLFGSLSLRCDAASVPSGAQQKRRVGLLALLAIGGERGVSRDRLQAFLWPESDATRSRHALDQLVYTTRRSLGSDPIRSEGRDLRLDTGVIDSDIRIFEAALAEGRLSDAVDVYGGPLLDGFHLSCSRELEAWIDSERSGFEREYHKALELLARQSAAQGDDVAACSWWRKLALSDTLSSRVAAGAIQALASAGDRAGAIQHARSYQQLVRSELEVEPDANIENLIAELAGPPVSEIVRSARTGRAPVSSSGASDARRISGSAAVKSASPTIQSDTFESGSHSTLSTAPRGSARMRTLAITSLLVIALVGSFAVFIRAQGENLQRGPAEVSRTGGKAAHQKVNPVAQAFYLKGVNAWNDRSKDGLDTAVIYFRRAIEMDPAYAESYGGLANAYVMLGYSGYRPAGAMFPKAKAAALRAIQLDSTFAPPHAALGMALTGERSFGAAESTFRKAIALDPLYPTAHQWYGILLMILGRTDEAVAETGRAARLDPLSLQIQNNYATFLSSSGQHAAALRHYQQFIGEEPDSSWVRRNPWLLTNMAGLYAANGQHDKAMRYAERAVEINPRHPRALIVLAAVHDRMGKSAEGRAIFARADTTNEHYAAYRAFRYAGEGNADSAFIWFDRVREWGVPVLISLGSPGSFAGLRDDPRFDELMKRLGMANGATATSTR